MPAKTAGAFLRPHNRPYPRTERTDIVELRWQKSNAFAAKSVKSVLSQANKLCKPVWVQEAPSSNLGTRTKNSPEINDFRGGLLFFVYCGAKQISLML